MLSVRAADRYHPLASIGKSSVQMPSRKPTNWACRFTVGSQCDGVSTTVLPTGSSPSGTSCKTPCSSPPFAKVTPASSSGTSAKKLEPTPLAVASASRMLADDVSATHASCGEPESKSIALVPASSTRRFALGFVLITVAATNRLCSNAGHPGPLNAVCSSCQTRGHVSRKAESSSTRLLHRAVTNGLRGRGAWDILVEHFGVEDLSMLL